MNLNTINEARILLSRHSNEDFVSKKDAKDCADKLAEIISAYPKIDLIFDLILEEVKRAEIKHPDWPNDKVYAATIVSEENGELTRACLQFESESGSIEEIKKEAIQTAATCVRLLEHIND